jgi:N-methylhydantoinase A
VAALTPRFVAGVDVGGTFTDSVVFDGQTTYRAKVPSTPHNLSAGIIEALELASNESGHNLKQLLPLVRRLGIGTTAVTNVLASRTGLRVGLLTTLGFEDLMVRVPLKSGRNIRAFDEVILDRSLVCGIDERSDKTGHILVPLNPDEVVSTAEDLIRRGSEALVVSFLWSCVNASHESLALDALRSRFPSIGVFGGAECLPVMREYERTMFAVMNAYVSQAFSGLPELEAQLRAKGLQVPLFLVHSGGGSKGVLEAARTPASFAYSGPAIGVRAAALATSAHDLGNAITCDMGGTTLDVSVVSSGQPIRRQRGDLLGIRVAMPSVDVSSVGTGGGSVAWIDSLGILRVGPVSAGSQPGPACYGRGGIEPTLTDALLLLGYLSADEFLGGAMHLYPDQAIEACSRIAMTLGMSTTEAAWGIREVALAGMSAAVRGFLAQRGLTAADHAVVSYGGCGALFSASLATDIGSQDVLVPEASSVLSALGAATAEVRHERSVAVLIPLGDDGDALEAALNHVRYQVVNDLERDGVAPTKSRIEMQADLRFRGQQWDITVELPTSGNSTDHFAALRATFLSEYVRHYGEGALFTGVPIDVVTVRAIGLGEHVTDSPFEAASYPRAKRIASNTVTPDGWRPVQVDRRGEPILVAHHSWQTLLTGDYVVGPALIDGRDTTVWVPVGMDACVTATRSLHITNGGEATCSEGLLIP